MRTGRGLSACAAQLTVLVKEHDIASSKVDGVSSAQAGHCGRRQSCAQEAAQLQQR